MVLVQMLGRRLEQLLNEIRQRRNEHEFVKIQPAKKESAMPMGKGTYGSTRGRPPKKTGLTKKQKTLPASLQKKIMASKKKK
jgi:hypothetical protein